MTHETLKWKLFLFSLSKDAKQWYSHIAGSIHGNWIELRDKFCSAFFLLPHICSLRVEVLTFRQNKKESIDVAWVIFTLLVHSGHDLSLPEYMLLQHFYTWLDKKSAHHLNITSRGSFAHLTLTEGTEILDKILDRTSFVCVHESPSAELEVRHEKVPVIESEQLENQSIDSTPEPSPELKSKKPEDEDPQPLEFLQNFEEDLFEDYGNTSNYSYQR